MSPSRPRAPLATARPPPPPPALPRLTVLSLRNSPPSPRARPEAALSLDGAGARPGWHPLVPPPTAWRTDGPLARPEADGSSLKQRWSLPWPCLPRRPSSQEIHLFCSCTRKIHLVFCCWICFRHGKKKEVWIYWWICVFQMLVLTNLGMQNSLYSVLAYFRKARELVRSDCGAKTSSDELMVCTLSNIVQFNNFMDVRMHRVL